MFINVYDFMCFVFVSTKCVRLDVFSKQKKIYTGCLKRSGTLDFRYFDIRNYKIF